MWRCVRKLSRRTYGALSNAAAASPRTARNFMREIAAALLEQQRCIARGGLAVGDRGKRLDFNLDRLPMHPRQCAALVREHHGERLAHIADLATAR